jgi:solute carrier family 8 (sodium/calcium exchanger)
LLVGTSSWREQFIEALKVTTDDDEEEDGGDDEKKEGEDGDESGENKEAAEKEPKQPSISDYLIHFISLFWKILFAFVPPTGIFDSFESKS